MAKRQTTKTNPSRRNIMATTLKNTAIELKSILDEEGPCDDSPLIEDEIRSTFDHANEMFVKKRRYKKDRKNVDKFEKAIKKGRGFFRKWGDSKTIDFREPLRCYDGKSSKTSYKRKSRDNNVQQLRAI